MDKKKINMVSTNNKLMAEFMGAEYDKGTMYGSTAGDYIFSDGRIYLGHELKYHTSWDWLMPVLKKINLKLNPSNYGEWRMINRPTEYNIEDSYAQAVQFIKKYNDGKQ